MHATRTSATPRILITGRILSGTLDITDGLLAVEADRIVYAGTEKDYRYPGPATLHRLKTGHLVLPGLIDLHCHGAFGTDFPSADPAAAREAIELLHRSGTTMLLASLVTASGDDLLGALSVLEPLAAAALIAGIHLEGPFISSNRCGAQNPVWIRDPDLGLARELISAGRGAIKTMTYAPELPRATELVDLLISRNVVPSLGHTDADSVTTRKALLHVNEQLTVSDLHGRTGTVTHLFNGMAPMHHRNPGPVPACLQTAKDGKAVLELIADDTHLDAETVVTVFGLVGADNIALVTDSMAAAGLSDGVYTLGPSTVEVHEGVARVTTGGAIAGGTATLIEVLRRTISAGVAAPDAVQSATATPARILGLQGDIGDLQPGCKADLITVNPEFQLQAVMRRGEWLTPARIPSFSSKPRPVTSLWSGQSTDSLGH